MKQLPPVAAQTQRLHGSPHLDASILVAAEQFSAESRQITAFSAAVQLCEQALAQLVIHRAAIIGVNQTEVPQFRALVNIRIAGRGNHQQPLCQGIHGAEENDRRYECLDLLQKRVRPAARSR